MISRKAKYRAIHHYRSAYSVQKMCSYFHVSRSAYYAWLKKKDFPDKHADLIKLIQECHLRYRKTYGYRRIRIWLQRRHGLTVNAKLLKRLMSENNMQSVIRRKWKYERNANICHLYPNHLDRNFTAQAPNQKWVTDISYIPTASCNTYLAVIKDLYDNSIISYKLQSRLTVSLVLDTIKEAVGKESFREGMILHSDQGFQYTHDAYLAITSQYGILQSMWRRGNCLDNACCENFFSHLKTELTHRCRFNNIVEAENAIADYIDFYNNELIQLKTEQAPAEYRHLFYCSS